jgi:hypothetical protein
MGIETFVRRAELQDLPDTSLRAVRALRRWVAAHMLGRCAVAALHAQLGCGRAAAHLHLFLEEVGAVWPDAFR